jgi:hypothetical protein
MDPLSDELRARIAVYLIEREAIWWRRQQWTKPGNKEHRARDVELKYLQDRYARPQAVAPTSVKQRAEDWMKSTFGGKPSP